MIKNGVSVCRLDYTACTTYKFPGTGRVAKCTGSSLNKKRKNAKTQKENIEKKAAIADKIGIGKIYVNLLGYAKNSKQGAKRKSDKPKGYSIGRTAKKLIRQRGIALWRCGRCRTFVTLSFIAPVPDRVAIRCLQNYIRSWRKDDKDINYLWIAERQQNGNVHFHILSSRRYDIEKENNRWIRVQYNAGLKFRDDCGFEIERWEIECLIKSGTLKKHLNPFDVKPVKTQSGIISYLTKYVTKTQEKKNLANDDEKNGAGDMAEFEFRAWRCSHRVSKIFTGIVSQKETADLMFSKKNVRKQTKDYFKNNVLKYPRGYIHNPVFYSGLWANKIAVYNYNCAGGQYAELDALNRGVLIKGDKPEIEYINEYDFYLQYCIPVTGMTVEMIGEPIYFNPYPQNDANAVYWDKNNVYSYHPDINGRLAEPGNYRLKNGQFYRVGRFTDEELKFLSN